jgi:hypothetical protein
MADMVHLQESLYQSSGSLKAKKRSSSWSLELKEWLSYHFLSCATYEIVLTEGAIPFLFRGKDYTIAIDRTSTHIDMVAEVGDRAFIFCGERHYPNALDVGQQ